MGVFPVARRRPCAICFGSVLPVGVRRCLSAAELAALDAAPACLWRLGLLPDAGVAGICEERLEFVQRVMVASLRHRNAADPDCPGPPAVWSNLTRGPVLAALAAVSPEALSKFIACHTCLKLCLLTVTLNPKP